MFERIRNRKYLIIAISVSLAIILAITHLAVAVHNASRMPGAVLQVYAQSNPDAYGNEISIVHISYYNSSDGLWYLLEDIISSEYTEGMTIQVPSDTPLKIGVYVMLNGTLASDPTDAENKVKVFVTVDAQWDHLELTEKSAEMLGGGQWYRVWCGTSYNFTMPPDTSWSVTIEYQAYY